MKKYIWGRVGISFHLTEEEFRILSSGMDEDKAVDLLRSKLASGEFLPSGETYFPVGGDGDVDGWMLSEEITLDL